MPKDWKKALQAGLKGRGRIVIMGVGNPLKGDDAAGLLIVEQVMKNVPAKARPGVRIFRTYDVPENYTGKIRKFKPARILIIDAALAGLKPGDVFILEKEKIAIEEISSHKIPLMVLISYLEQSTGCKVTVLGIQAKDLSFGAPITPIVKTAVKTVADFLAASLSPKTRRRGLLNVPAWSLPASLRPATGLDLHRHQNIDVLDAFLGLGLQKDGTVLVPDLKSDPL